MLNYFAVRTCRTRSRSLSHSAPFLACSLPAGVYGSVPACTSRLSFVALHRRARARQAEDEAEEEARAREGGSKAFRLDDEDEDDDDDGGDGSDSEAEGEGGEDGAHKKKAAKR